MKSWTKNIILLAILLIILYLASIKILGELILYLGKIWWLVFLVLLIILISPKKGKK